MGHRLYLMRAQQPTVVLVLVFVCVALLFSLCQGKSIDRYYETYVYVRSDFLELAPVEG